MINTVLNMSPVGANTVLGICAIPIVVLCVQPTCVLRCGLWYHVLCYALNSQHDPYTPLRQISSTPVDTNTTKHTKIFPHPRVPGCAPGHTQSITDRTIGGLSTC